MHFHHLLKKISGTPGEAFPLEKLGAATPSRSSCAGVQTDPKESREPSDDMSLL